MSLIRNIALRMKTGTEDLNYGRHIVRGWASDYLVTLADKGQKKVHLLDIGCGGGTDLLNTAYDVRTKCKDLIPELRLSGIETHGPYREACANVGIETFALDIEQDSYPAKDAFYDVIIANQVLEHVKEVFWVMAETGRILKPGGRFIVGVPNLASFHNRLLLLFGRQPTAQQTLSAHVRTFTKPDFKKFAEKGDYFRVLDVKGSNFYPFGRSVAEPLARLFPTMAWGIFFLLERTERKGSFLECLYEDFLETNFYGGPLKPALEIKSSVLSSRRKK